MIRPLSLGLLGALWAIPASAASALYPAWAAALLAGSPVVSLGPPAQVACGLTDVVTHPYSSADVFLADIPAPARVGHPATLMNMTFTNGRVMSDPIVFARLTGSTADAIDCWLVGTTEANSRLVVHIVGLHIVPDGSTVTITWNPTYGLFTL